ncbi:hypothetical protein [Hungatella sp.]|uniref:hypothetical protein n=1 Tax=Hungatella sp. TaxID=2613924 RepID=UPI003AB8FF6A
MADKLFQEENHIYQFDFSQAVWATDQLNRVFQNNKAGILSDVDFIAETDHEVILLEYKNASIPGAAHPERFQPSDQRTLQKIAYKYYDAWIYLKAAAKNKPFHYIYILEYPNGDSVSRRAIRNSIVDLLPFELQRLPEIKENMIAGFDVFSIAEWNTHDIYKAFPITPITEGTEALF